MSSNTTSETAEPFLVIGAGKMRTGVFSLHLALEKLLDGKCYHMRYIMENPEDMAFWESALSQDLSDEQWKHFFRHYRGAVDYPSALFYKRLMKVYPEARIVLSVRDPHEWFQSVNDTVKLKSENAASTEEGPMENFTAVVQGMIQSSNETVDLGDEKAMIEAFKRHTEEVKRCVPSDKLLIFEAKDGWTPLCNFLGVPVPNEPYPVTNTLAELRSRHQSDK